MFDSSSPMQETVNRQGQSSILRPGFPVHWTRREAQRSMYRFLLEGMWTLEENNVLIFVAVVFLLQFYLKLEEKHQAMEEEKVQLEAKLKVFFFLLLSIDSPLC
jgi:hypothetical protein